MIDFHVHQPSAGGATSLYGSGTYSGADYVTAMDSLGIDLSVVFTLDGLWSPSPAANDSLAAWVADAPDRLVAFGTVDPHSPHAAREAERCITELGMRGFKFHTWIQGFSPHAPSMDSIAEVAARHRVPMLFHDGTPPYSAPLQIAALARRHPDVPVVLGHGGLQDMWREAIAAVNGTSNVHICLCATPNHAMRLVAERCPSGRLLFGTDGGLGDTPHQHLVEDRVEEVRTLPIDETARRAMLVDNPRRLLQLEKP